MNTVMPTIDISSLFFFSSIVFTLFSLELLFVWRLQRTHFGGIAHWALGTLLCALYLMTFPFRFEMHDLLRGLFFTGFAAGLILVRVGNALFTRRDYNRYMYGATLIAFAFAALYNELYANSEFLRIMLISPIIALTLITGGIDLAVDVPASLKTTFWPVATVYIILGVLSLIRIPYTILFGIGAAPDQFNQGHIAYFILTFMIAIFWTYGHFMMISTRLEYMYQGLLSERQEDHLRLEQSVLNRTEELRHAKMLLEQDIERRSTIEDELIVKQRQLRSVSHQLISLQEHERSSLSRELHDDLGQRLSRIQLDLERMKINNGKATESSTLEALETLLSMTAEATKTLRSICKGLHPSMLNKLGLNLALQSLVKDFSDVFTVELDLQSPEELNLPPRTALSIYRIVQEALNNAARHSGATQVTITLTYRNNHLMVQIQDNGKGFVHPEISGIQGLGLVSMRERASLCDGWCEVFPSKGGGTKIVAEIPVDEDDAGQELQGGSA